MKETLAEIQPEEVEEASRWSAVVPQGEGPGGKEVGGGGDVDPLPGRAEHQPPGHWDEDGDRGEWRIREEDARNNLLYQSCLPHEGQAWHWIKNWAKIPPSEGWKVNASKDEPAPRSVFISIRFKEVTRV